MAANTTVGPQNSLKFDYDAKGRRIRRQVWSNKTWSNSPTNDVKFLYDGWNLMAELNALNSNARVRTYTWGSDLSGTMQGAGGVGGLLEVVNYGTPAMVCFVAYDGNGNVAALVNAADGKTVCQYEYGPFGELLRATGPMARANPFRFSTKYQDEESDLLYYGYRYYSSSTGRWLSRDPIRERGSANLYSFANGNPIARIDALGFEGVDIIPTPNQWANALAWISAWLVDKQYIETKRFFDVRCPAGSRRYLLSKEVTKVAEISLLEIDLLGWDLPMAKYKVTRPISHLVIEHYGCCASCGWFTKNTTPWDYDNREDSKAAYVASAEFGPLEASATVSTHTSIRNKFRKCKSEVAPERSFEYNELPRTPHPDF